MNIYTETFPQMPKEHRKRGRREEQKRKRQKDDDDEEHLATLKRLKAEDGMDGEDELKIVVDGDEASHREARNDSTYLGDIPFFGLLDEEEQTYFKHVDALLELNQFENAEERALFLASVYREANGKELKIANSQSCSRLMERLILMSNSAQLKALFQKFSGHFLHLVQHRFASHCCEALFMRAAPAVTEELVAPVQEEEQDAENGGIYVSMENLFLYTINELEGYLGYLMTDPFASHALRVLLIVLSGRPLASATTTSLLQSKKKEKVDVANKVSNESDLSLMSRSVPDSFAVSLDKMISGTVLGLDTTYLRALATHPIGNPVLQLLLELEFSTIGKQKAKEDKSLFGRLLPDDPLTQGTTSASFITSLLYDPVGSRLLETIIEFAPGKVFKALYKNLFREKLGALVKNETAGFVMIKILERLSRDDLQYAVQQICPHIGILIERSRLSIIKIMIDRCQVRQINNDVISEQILKCYDAKSTTILPKILELDMDDKDEMAPERKKQLEAQDSRKSHASLLVQSMLDAQGSLRDMITSSLLSTDLKTLVSMAKSRTASFVLQKSLTCSGQTKPFLRQIVQQFYGHISDLALDPIASHVVDTFWTATQELLFIRERIAQELIENEAILKESFSGRAVWRNWMMDLYKRRRLEWISNSKSVPDHFISADSKSAANDKGSTKTGIELARERFAASKGGNRGAFKGK